MNPRIRAAQAITVWLPQIDPTLALRTRLPVALSPWPEPCRSQPDPGRVGR